MCFFLVESRGQVFMYSRGKKNGRKSQIWSHYQRKEREKSLPLAWIFFGGGASSGVVYQQCTVAVGMAVYRLYSACGFAAYGRSCFPSTIWHHVKGWLIHRLRGAQCEGEGESRYGREYRRSGGTAGDGRRRKKREREKKRKRGLRGIDRNK